MFFLQKRKNFPLICSRIITTKFSIKNPDSEQRKFAKLLKSLQFINHFIIFRDHRKNVMKTWQTDKIQDNKLTQNSK